MDLFAVNRYNKNKLSPEDEEAQENRILQRLHFKHPTVNDKTDGDGAGMLKEEIESGESNNHGSIQTNSIVNDMPSIESKIKPTAKNNKLVEREESVPDRNPLSSNEIETEKSDFVVLGKPHANKTTKVEDILPPWLSHPTVIDSNLSKGGIIIKKVDYLDKKLKANLKKMGYERFFPVQETVIPWILNAHMKPTPFWPRDVCVSSPTGSGKTLAFAIPVVQMFLNRISPAIRALVILPVKELAEQVYNVFEKLCKGTKVRPLLLSQKQTFSVEQTKLIDCFNGEFMPKVDIIVTTAGRLVEHLHSTKGFTLKYLRFLIIDEADRVMDQIQNDWLYHLNKHVKEESDEYLLGRAAGQLSQTELFDKPRQPHKLLFSATISQDPEKLQTFKLFHPKLFTAVADPEERLSILSRYVNTDEKRGKFIGQYATPLELQEFICISQYRIKPLTLFALIKENNYKRFLCFTNSIDASHRLSFVLQRMFGKELVIEEWSSSLSTEIRKSVLARFTLGKVNGIICTDALARGIDIEDIDVVISYDMPRHINTYIHRVGRTGRAGNYGTSITMLIDEERNTFKDMLFRAGKAELQTIQIKSNAEEHYAAMYTSAIADLRDAIELEKQTIKKIRSGLSISSNKVNLLSVLKDRLAIDAQSAKEVIKTLVYLPKSWSNDAILSQANTTDKKRKRNKISSLEIATKKRKTIAEQQSN